MNKKRITFLLGFAVSAVFLYLFLKGQQWGETLEAFKAFRYAYLLPCVAVYLSSFLFRSCRWQMLLRPLKSISFPTSFVVIMISWMANNILPARMGEFVRALVIGKKDEAPTGHDKTSLMFSLKDNVGALYNALKPFADYGVTLTKIESRPQKGKAWDYIFFLDLEGHRTDANPAAALEASQEVGSALTLLGSYPRGRQGPTQDAARNGRSGS